MRKPDTPCSCCGRLLFSGRGSLPEGRRVCRQCRKKANAATYDVEETPGETPEPVREPDWMRDEPWMWREVSPW